ncbi:MAG: ribbon-helix-helix domain-containing protein, partial [Terrimicrobiaceae bacterium]
TFPLWFASEMRPDAPPHFLAVDIPSAVYTVCCMIRTQVYLTEEESTSLARISKSLGHGKSEVIRQAIDEFIDRRDANRRLRALRSARGMWADHPNLPDARKIRAAFDRF